MVEDNRHTNNECIEDNEPSGGINGTVGILSVFSIYGRRL